MSQTIAPVIEGPYVTDLLAQASTLRGLLGELATATLSPDIAASLKNGKFKRVVLTGMGSSWHALYPLHRALIRSGHASHWLEAAELLHGFEPLFARDTLLIAVSQSGESAEIVTLLKRAGEFGHVIGVTNAPDSSLGRLAHSVFHLHAGPEATVSCKTYLATLAVLHWLNAALHQRPAAEALDEITRATAAVDTYMTRWRRHVESLRPLVAGIKCVFVVGRGGSLATAGTGGLILKESTRQPSEGMSSAAFRHGPLEMSGPDVLVLVCEGSAATAPLNHRLVEDITRAGGRGFLLSDTSASSGPFRLPTVPEALRPLVEILPVQMLSLAIAARDGREAGRFAHASKITITA